MTLKARFLLYLALVHAVFVVVAGVLLRDQRLWLLLIEAFFVVAFGIAWWLTRRHSEPADMLRTGVELLASSDLMTPFRETPHPEVNRLIRLYNRMVDHLRDERAANQEQDSLGGALARELDGQGDGEARLVTIGGRRNVRCRRAYRSQIGERDRQDFESGLGVVVARTRHMNEFMRTSWCRSGWTRACPSCRSRTAGAESRPMSCPGSPRPSSARSQTARASG